MILPSLKCSGRKLEGYFTSMVSCITFMSMPLYFHNKDKQGGEKKGGLD